MTDPWSRAMRALREGARMSKEEREAIRKKEEEQLKEVNERDKAFEKRMAEENEAERRKTPEQKKQEMEEWCAYYGSRPVEFWLIVSNADPNLYWNPSINTGCFAKTGAYYRSREAAQTIIDLQGLDAHPELDYKRDGETG